MLLQKVKPTLSVGFAQNLARAEYIQHLYEVPRAQDRKHIWFPTFGNYSIQSMNTKVLKEFLKILGNY